MKVMILAGGLGTRLSEETVNCPKPMVQIGGHPILWHIINIYEKHGFDDFVILLGYRGYMIKEYFANYYLHSSDITIDLKSNQQTIHNNRSNNWRITLVDTGDLAMTGARVRKGLKYTDGKPFMLTYGDGLADINIPTLIESHKQSKKLLTVTGVQPEGRFGSLKINDNNEVMGFEEKPQGDNQWINGGFFVCEQGIIDYLPEGDDLVFEQGPLNKLAENNQLNAYYHRGFWKPMDTLRDKHYLEELWKSSKAPWKNK